MHLSPKAFAACALLSFSPLCLADVYIGGTGLVSTTDSNDMKAGIGGKGFLGFRPESVPMTFEAGYLTTGKIDYRNDYIDQGGNIYTNLDVTLSGGYVALGYYGRFGRNGTGGFAKLGAFSGKSKLEGDQNGIPGGIKKNSTGALINGGIDLMMTPNFGFRFDVDALIGVNDFRDLDESHKGIVTTLNAGIIFSFGGSGVSEQRYGRRGSRASAPAPVFSPAVPAPVYSAPADAPVYSPPVVPAPAPEPAAASAPVAVTEPAAQAPVVDSAPQPAPAGKASAGTAQLVPGAVLRSGPTMKSAAIKSMPNGGAVKLLKRETNEEGPWWSVQLEDGTTGWMIEWGLTRISRR